MVIRRALAVSAPPFYHLLEDLSIGKINKKNEVKIHLIF